MIYLFKIADLPAQAPAKVTTQEWNQTVVIKSKYPKKGVIKKTVVQSQSTGNKKCYHKWFKETDMANSIIQYACDISNSDIDFILTLNSENWSRDYKKQSNVIQKNWVREPSFWVCQMHYRYHKEDVYEWLPFNRIYESRYLTDRKYQVEVCWNKYKWGTRFYWYDHRYKGNKWLILIGNTSY